MGTTQDCVPEMKYYMKEDMESQNISSLAINFRQSLEYPGDTPVVDGEEIIFDAQEFNRRIVDIIQVSEIQANKIEGRTIDEQRRTAKLVSNKQITEMIHNDK